MMSVILPLGAFAGDEVEKYFPKIKRIFDIGDEYEESHVFRNSGRSEESSNISWTSGNDNINVQIDLDGNIISYNKYSGSDREEHARFAKISKEEALENAKAMINKIDSSLLKKLEYEDREMMSDINNYHFMFVRKENDIPFNYNTVSVQVDNITGEIKSIYMNWDKDIKLPNRDNLISKEEAYKLYKEGEGVELVYMLSNEDSKLEGNLLYTVEDKNKAIDAKTGKEIENLNSMNGYFYYGLYGNKKKVSSEDAKKLISSKEIISKDQASKELIEFADLDKSYTIEGSDLMKNELDESYSWEIQIHKQEGNSGYGTTVSVDAKTNEVLNFHNFTMNEEEESKYSEEESLEKAKEFLEEKVKDKYKQVEYAGSVMYQFEENIQNYSFRFNRVMDEVKIPQNGFSVSINSATGEIMDYNLMWNDIKVPSKEDLVEKEKAEEVLLGDKTLELNYIVDKASIKNKKKEIKLVYNLSDEENLFIDAKTGETVDSKDLFSFNSISEREKEYEDIDKSYAKDQIKKLKEVGIYLPGENFNPKKGIIQKDFLYLLTNTKGYIAPYQEDFIYEPYSIGDTLKAGEKDPEKVITRGEAVKYIVRSFGQEKSANLGDIYKSNYEDIDSMSKELKGYVAVAEGLGIFSGEGEFRPDDNLTREEAAVIIYNILNR